MRQADYASAIWPTITGSSVWYGPRSWEPICVTLISIKRLRPPHACMGPGCAAQCVSAELEKYLPRPRVRFDGTRYYTDYDDESSVGKIRQFQGSLAAVLRAYSWVMSLGVDGLKAVAETAILNNNYMMKRVLNEVRGISMSWAEEAPNRLEQVRYSFETLLQETGVDAEHVNRHMLDFDSRDFSRAIIR